MEENDKFVMQLCVNSYKGEYGEVKKGIITQIAIFDKGNVQGFMGTKDDVLYIVFEGTNGVRDWLDNSKFFQKKLKKSFSMQKELQFQKNSKVHYGFYDQYMRVEEDIKQRIYEKKYKKIVCTGHSLGGALATLCAFWVSSFHESVECVTFGSPRVGNKYFTKMFNWRIPNSRRYVYKNDLIAKLPLLWLFYSYRHVSSKVSLGKKKSWWRKLLRPISTAVGSIQDHYPQRYLEAINGK